MRRAEQVRSMRIMPRSSTEGARAVCMTSELLNKDVISASISFCVSWDLMLHCVMNAVDEDQDADAGEEDISEDEETKAHVRGSKLR